MLSIPAAGETEGDARHGAESVGVTGPLFPEVGIIALVPDCWGPYWQLRHHLLSRLARYFHVVWADLPATWRQWGRDRNYPLAQPLPEGLQVYTAPWFLRRVGRPRFLQQWTEGARLRRCRDLLLAKGCRRLVLYLWRPEFASALDQLPHDLACYHIDDEYPYSPVEQPIAAEEAALIRRAQQVFIHSVAMMRKKGGLNPNTDLLPNGVDFESYVTPAAEPEDLARIPRPCIGYTGNLKRMVDWELLLQLTARHPQWSFVFVGPAARHATIRVPLGTLAQRPNVHFLGPKNVNALCAYPQHFDVAIMPYCVDAYTNYIYPLKLHEYLASGKPVVGSPIATLQSFRDVVCVARGIGEWSEALTCALAPPQNSREARARRQAVARSHDWEILAQRAAATLMQRLGRDTEKQWVAWLQHSGTPACPALSR
ncbi:MAG TPA: glycosyltransferase [Terriglobales bacterium]|nr:glycosyltransferase [Terriglobales bacterium]